MELVNDAYRLKDGLYGDPAGEAALRFATATAASLIFPFAPHLGGEVYEQLDRRARLGAALAARPTRRCSPATRFTLVVQVNGKRRDQIVAAAGRARGGAARARPGERERRAATSTARQVVKEIVVPGKLVNLVVKADSQPRLRAASGRKLACWSGASPTQR